MNSTPEDFPIQFIRLPEVLAMVGLSRMTIYRMVASDQFPRQVKLGANSVAWVKSEVLAWCQDRVAESRTSAAPDAD